MSRWLRLQLADGTLDGKRIIPAATLARTHVPQIVSQPPTSPTGRAGFYGLGWNVSYDDSGKLRLSHSGAFELGTNANVTMLPLEKLGIVVLTNGAPVGLADAVALDFFDVAQHGKATTDWLPLLASVYAKEVDGARSPTDYAHPPASAKPAKDSAAYTGTYDNPYYGKATVTADNKGALTLALGPKPMLFPLTHYDGDTFSFETTGEMAAKPHRRDLRRRHGPRRVPRCEPPGHLHRAVGRMACPGRDAEPWVLCTDYVLWATKVMRPGPARRSPPQ